MSLALCEVIARHLGIPQDCIVTTWAARIIGGRYVSATNVIATICFRTLDDELYEELHYRREAENPNQPYCCVCLRNCGDADDDDTRHLNCIRCLHCYLCPRCSITMPYVVRDYYGVCSSNVCLFCLEQSEMSVIPEMSASERLRRRLLCPHLRWDI